ncbi:MAG: NTPase [Planctomycetota bacterium]|jgi:nucleoside-triphosphatase
MQAKPAKILLTGLPGCGKTTAVTKIIAALDRVMVAGFYTQEIRQDDARKGFRWTRLDGASGILAHVNIKGRFKVGRYGVDIAAFEKNVVPVLDPGHTDARLFVVDEIGKMECFSEKFTSAVRRLFESDRAVLATVAQKGGGLISQIKNYQGTTRFNLTHQNRDETVAEILEILSFLKVPPT